MVDVLYRGVLDELVLEGALALIVLEGQDLPAGQPNVPVILPQEDLAVAQAGDDVARGRLDVQDEHYVILAGRIGHGDALGADDGAREAVGERRPLEVLDVTGAVSPEARDIAAVLDADDELAARCVGEGADMLGNLPVILAGAFAVPPEPRGAPKGRPTSLGANHGKQGSHHHEGA